MNFLKIALNQGSEKIFNITRRFYSSSKHTHCISETKGSGYMVNEPYMCNLYKSQKYCVLVGKHYFEVSCHDQGLCRVGWSSMQASLDLGKCF